MGRLSSGFFAHSLGVVHMTVAACICSGALIFSMVTIDHGNVTSIIVIAILFGYSTGICE